MPPSAPTSALTLPPLHLSADRIMTQVEWTLIYQLAYISYKILKNIDVEIKDGAFTEEEKARFELFREAINIILIDEYKMDDCARLQFLAEMIDAGCRD